MWERKYRKSHDQATEAELEQFNFALVSSNSPLIVRHSPIPSSTPNTSVPASPEALDLKTLTISQTKAPPALKLPSKGGSEVLVRVPAQLHLYDAVQMVFMLQDDHVTASVVETGTWECKSLALTLLIILDWLSITASGKTWISQQMEADMNPVFNYVSSSQFHLLIEGTSFIHLELL
jgi:hypothetical protein